MSAFTRFLDWINSEVPSADALTGAEKVPLIQTSATKQSLLSTIADYVVQTATAFLQSGTGAQPRTVQAKLREVISVKDFGAVGDNSTDDTTALANALVAAAGKTLYIPAGTYLTTAELSYAANTADDIEIRGDGPNSVLKASGASNKVLHITGVAGVTTNPVVVKDLAITSGTSGTSSVGLHLDGIAYFLVENVWIDGNSKMTDGIRCTAAQQGQVSGGGIVNCTNGAVLEDNAGAGVRSNGIDWHGMTFANTTTNFKVIKNGSSVGSDSVMFHQNHLTSATQQMDVYCVWAYISGNHFEGAAVARDGLIVREGRALITGNLFSGTSGTVDINILADADQCMIVGNIIDANITIAAGVTDTFIGYNSTGGTCTNGGTRTTRLKNIAYAGTGFNDSLTLTDGVSGSPPLTVSGKAGQQALAISVDAGSNAYITTVSSSDESLLFQNAGGGTLLKLNKNGMVQGLAASNGPVGTVTLTANVASTTVNNTGVTASSIILLFPTSANAAADVGSAGGVYISAQVASTSFTITHPNNANADKTFNYIVLN